MKIFFGILILFCLAAESSVVQSQSVTWEKSISLNENPEVASISCIVEKPTGGYILTGYNFNLQMFALGLSANGDSLWYKTYPFSFGYRIINLNDSNFLIMNYKAELVKIDSAGNILWTNLPPHNGLSCTQIKLIDNNIFISGENRNIHRPFFLKKNLLGSTVFYKDYLSFENGIIRDFINYQSGFILFGNLIPTSNKFYIKLDSNGNLIYNYLTNEHIIGEALEKINSEDSLMFGGINGSRACIMKTDLDGYISWIKYFDSGPPSFGRIMNLYNDLNGGIITFGEYTPFIHFKARLIKCDYAGNILWQKLYGFEEDQFSAKYIIQTRDSGYAFTGNRSKQGYNFHIIKTDKNGNVKPTSINNNSSIVISDFRLFQNYPNPFNPVTVIQYSIPSGGNDVKLVVYNNLGKEILTLVNEKQNAGSYAVNFNGESFPSGVYFYKLYAGEFVESKRMILLK